MSIKLCGDDLCTNCGACVNICPKSAISFCEPNLFGNTYPFINYGKCIGCGLCLKACPQLKPFSISKEIPSYYAGWSKHFRLFGSSGGVFGELASLFLKQKGIVVGAAYNQDGVLVHSFVEKDSDLSFLLGSKYVTSDTRLIYRQVKDELKQGRHILFCGTPCQISALYSIIPAKDRTNLLTIDLVCWGAPPQSIYQSYINKLSKVKKSKILKYSFRVLNSNRLDLHVSSGKKSLY